MAVKGESPVTFVSEDTQPGKQFQVPLALLSFDATGTTIDFSAWPAYGTLSGSDQTSLKNLVASLVSQRFLTQP
jgi:hypothetical protein